MKSVFKFNCCKKHSGIAPESVMYSNVENMSFNDSQNSVRLKAPSAMSLSNQPQSIMKKPLNGGKFGTSARFSKKLTGNNQPITINQVYDRIEQTELNNDNENNLNKMSISNRSPPPSNLPSNRSPPPSNVQSEHNSFISSPTKLNENAFAQHNKIENLNDGGNKTINYVLPPIKLRTIPVSSYKNTYNGNTKPVVNTNINNTSSERYGEDSKFISPSQRDQQSGNQSNNSSRKSSMNSKNVEETRALRQMTYNAFQKKKKLASKNDVLHTQATPSAGPSV